MSDRTVIDRLDTLPTRMLDVIDALPVPAGPGRLRPRRTFVARLDPAPALLLLLITLAIAAVLPPGQSAVAEAARWIQRILAIPAWTSYHIEAATTSAAGLETRRIVFSAGQLPGMPARPDVSSYLAYIGGWSPDGEHVAISAGSKIYVGDRSGWLREVADLGELSVNRLGWTGVREVTAVASGSGAQAVVLVDTQSRSAVRRALPFDLVLSRPASARSPVHQTRITFSPAGGWLAWEGGTANCTSVLLFEVATGRVIPLIDGAQRGMVIGWLDDGRLVTGTCDADGTALALHVGRPENGERLEVARRSWATRDPRPIVDRSRSRIVFAAVRPGEAGTLEAVELEGRTVVLGRFPDLGDIFLIAVSGDGRYLSFDAQFIDPSRASRSGAPELGQRAGVIDLDTGDVVFACDSGCYGLALR